MQVVFLKSSRTENDVRKKKTVNIDDWAWWHSLLNNAFLVGFEGFIWLSKNTHGFYHALTVHGNSLPGYFLHVQLRRTPRPRLLMFLLEEKQGRKKMVFGYQIVQKINFGLRHIVSVSHLVFFVCSPPCPILLWGSCRASQYKMDGLNSGWTLFNHKSWHWMHSKLDA